MIFSKVVPRPLGVPKQVVEGHFEEYLTHVSPCNFLKTPLKWAILGLRALGGPGGTRGGEGLSLERVKTARKGLGEV